MSSTSRRYLSRRQVLASAGATGVAAVAGVGSAAADGHDGREFAVVRAAHFSPDAPNVDVYVGDHRILADVPFGAISGYTSLRPGRYRVRITAAGAPDTVAFDDHLDLPAGEFTVAATGELSEGTFEPLVLEDDAGRPGGRRASGSSTPRPTRRRWT